MHFWKPYRKSADMKALPPMFVYDVLKLLPLKDACRMGGVCRLWNSLSNQVLHHVKTFNTTDLGLTSLDEVTLQLKNEDGYSAELEFYGSEIVSAGLQQILPKIGRSLEKLVLEKTVLDGPLWSIVLQLCPDLKHIRMQKVALIIEDLPKLRLDALSVQDIYFYTQGIATNSLDTSHASQFSQWINNLQIFKLEINQCDVELGQTIEFGNLKQIEITDVSAQFSEVLPRFGANLTSLSLAGINHVKISSIKHLESLTNLSLADGLFPLGLFEEVTTSLPQLREFSVRNCHHVTSLQGLTALQHLRHLNLTGCAISHTDAHAIAQNCSEITKLRLCSVKIDDIGLSLLKLPNLKKLCLYNCKAISDKGVCQILGNSPNVKSLCLEWCQGITNATIAALASSKKLEELDIGFTACTMGGLIGLDQKRSAESLGSLTMWMSPMPQGDQRFASGIRIVNLLAEPFPW